MNIHHTGSEELEPYWTGIIDRLNADHTRAHRAALMARDFLVAERSIAYQFKWHHLKQLFEREDAIRKMVAAEDIPELNELLVSFDSHRLRREEKGERLLEIMIRRQPFKPLQF